MLNHSEFKRLSQSSPDFLMIFKVFFPEGSRAKKIKMVIFFIAILYTIIAF